MMRIALPFAALAAALTLVLVGPVRADDDKKLSDEEFVRKAAAGGLFEVKSAQFAMDQASSDQAKKFARHLLEDHTKANQELMALAARKGWTVPPGMEQKQADMLARVGKMTGKSFDSEFAKQQVDAHEETIKLFERAAKDCKDSDLRDWADKKVPALKEHLKMARDLSGGGKGDRDTKDNRDNKDR